MLTRAEKQLAELKLDYEKLLIAFEELLDTTGCELESFEKELEYAKARNYENGESGNQF